MKLKNGQTVLFVGDSITDCGRSRPVGQGAGLGNGYVAFVDSLLATCFPQDRIKILNTGLSGNRVVDLESRWQRDVLELNSDWLSVMIGINDVWRQFDNDLGSDQVLIERYEETYRRVLAQAHPKLKGLILMTPYYLESNKNDPMRQKMDEYGGIVKQLATEFDAVFIDVQAAFDKYLQQRPTQSLSGDRVHPNKTGHMIIAKAFLSAIGFDWNAASRQAQISQ